MDLSFIPYFRRTWASFFRMLRNFPSSACFVCTSMLYSKVIQEVVTAANTVGGKVIWLTSGPSSLLPTWLEKPAIGQAGEQKKQALVRGCDSVAPVPKPAATDDHVHVKERVHFENCNISHRLLSQSAFGSGAVWGWCTWVCTEFPSQGLCLSPVPATSMFCLLNLAPHGLSEP